MERTRAQSEETRIERPVMMQRAVDPSDPADSLVVDASAEREPWDWARISSQAPPVEPAPTSEYETAARAVLRAFRPGLVSRISGAARRQRSELERAVVQAANADVVRNSAAAAAHRAAHHEWSVARSLAPGVMRLEEAACRRALRFAMAYRDVSEAETTVMLDSVVDGVATVTCAIDDPYRFPLPARPRASTSRIPMQGAHALLGDDHLCSLAIRIAGETCSILPVRVVVVNVTTERVDPTTGKLVIDTLLGMRFHGRRDPAVPVRIAHGSTPPYGGAPGEGDEWDGETPTDWEGDTVRLSSLR